MAVAQENQATKANDLWKTGNRLEALPYYEELSKQYPTEWLYAERLLICLEAKAHDATNPAEKRALLLRMREAAQLAIKDGDPNVFVQNAANIDVDAAMQKPPETPALKLFNEGEKLFGKGDYPAAIEKYAAAAEADPTMYEAPLYAGDAAYAHHDLKTAATWFARAISLDPNRETAYRYWGDAILKYGNDPIAAREKFIDAIVAEPYNRLAWQGLQQWAQVMKATLIAPKIERPAGPTVDPKNPKNINITVNFMATDDKKNPGASAWMMYSIVRATYHGERFNKEFPNEKEYRHTLKEEDVALTLVAENVAEKKIKPGKLDESLRNLIELQKTGMLDCWILINGADQGIAQDYAAYRKDHRQLVHDYLSKYVVHGGVTPRESF